MKQFNTVKNLLFASLLGAASTVNGQTVVHPVVYGPAVYGTDSSNWYKDYVGVRVQVNAPSSIAGDKFAFEATKGTAAGDWPNIVDVDLFDMPIVMPTYPTDSCFQTMMPAGSMAGKIAVVWRGPASGYVTFTQKAAYAQQAGAVAIVILNEYAGQPPFSPGSSATGPGSGVTITIPVFMVGNADGQAIANQYKIDSNSVRMTITRWGRNLNNDLGFIPNGMAGWHDYAIPSDQILSGLNPSAYKGLDGAYIGNFGINNATNVKLSSSLTFTPNGGSASPVHSDNISMGSHVFTGSNVAPGAAPDSVYAMFSGNEYNLLFPDLSTPVGRFDLTYNIISDSVDDNPGDNTAKVSFYSTDSLYSKARYDFTNNKPSVNLWRGGSEFLWGPMYYVAKGGAAVSRIQYSIATNSTTPGAILSNFSNVYIYKWIDGFTDTVASLTYPKDSIVQNGELVLLSVSQYSYVLASDTSEGTINLTAGLICDPTGAPTQIVLDSNSWYYVAVDPEGSTADPRFLGIDNILNPLPRIFGRYYNNRVMENTSLDEASPDTITYNNQQGNLPSPAPQSRLTFIRSIDSLNFRYMEGMIPSVAMIVNKNPVLPNAVKTVKAPFANISLFPNPASDVLTVSANMMQTQGFADYAVIDGLGRKVFSERHTNVLNDKFEINTTSFAPGNYYLVINIQGQVTTRKFTIVK
ncbi:MAG: PA domain-containing protein [Mucilaginibacter sp.]